MNKRKVIGAIMIGVMVCCIGCGQESLEKSTTLKKVKDITATVTDDDLLSQDEILSEWEKHDGSTSIAGVQVSLSCPEEWHVDAYEDDEGDDEYNSICATTYNTPKYDLNVEKKSYLYDKNGKDLIKSITKNIDNLSVNSSKKSIQKIKDSYTYNLQNDAYPKWTEVSFETKTINGQTYVIARGKLNTKKNKSNKGSYWYITIRNGKILEFQFTAPSAANMDDSVISIFESIMDTVKYD